MEASDAAEALEQVHRARPDLVIVDIFMPRMSGLELVTRLRAEPDLAGILPARGRGQRRSGRG